MRDTILRFLYGKPRGATPDNIRYFVEQIHGKQSARGIAEVITALVKEKIIYERVLESGEQRYIRND